MNIVNSLNILINVKASLLCYQSIDINGLENIKDKMFVYLVAGLFAVLLYLIKTYLVRIPKFQKPKQCLL